MEVSQLGVPFLMVNGTFRNHKTLTVGELERFIPFMTLMALRRSKVKGVPKWWVRTIKFKFPLKKPKGLSEMGYRRHLQSIVEQCYEYHDARFLLNFSSKFSECPESIFLRRNEGNTTTIFSVQTTAELFTFPNANKEYDKKVKEKPHKRSLLPPQPNKSSSQTITDIYLCENCDVEFYSLSDVQRHERQCYGTSVEEFSDEVEILMHIKPAPRSVNDKCGFLDYFGLGLKSEMKQKQKIIKEEIPEKTPVKRWVFLNMCLYRNRKIEFSSLLGRLMLKNRVKRDEMNRVERSILSNESFCSTNSIRLSREMKDFKHPRLTYRKSLNKQWTHTYCFNKQQRIEKMKTLQTGLNKRSRLLLKNCKPLVVRTQYLDLPLNAEHYLVCLRRMLIVPFGVPSDSESES